jgi:hypothetical protein
MAYRRLQKTEEEKKHPWTVFNPHTLDALLPMHETLTICLIDPGIKNCAVRVAQRKGDTITTILQTKTSFENYTDVMKYFIDLRPHLLMCHYIIVESQLRVNYDLIRMSQHIMSTIMLLVMDQGLRPLVIEVDATLKSRMLDAPKGLTKPQLKKWTTHMALRILESRGDHETVKLIQKAKKKDDHGDVVCYDQVFWLILATGNIVIPKII